MSVNVVALFSCLIGTVAVGLTVLAGASVRYVSPKVVSVLFVIVGISLNVVALFVMAFVLNAQQLRHVIATEPDRRSLERMGTFISGAVLDAAIEMRRELKLGSLGVYSLSQMGYAVVVALRLGDMRGAMNLGFVNAAHASAWLGFLVAGPVLQHLRSSRMRSAVGMVHRSIAHPL